MMGVWRRWSLLGACGLVLAGCAPEPAAERPSAPQQGGATVTQVDFAGTWVGFIAQQPSAFQALLGQVPDEAWQKLYQRRYAEASAAFAAGSGPAASIGRARAELELARLFKASAALTLDILARTSAAMTENADRIPRSPALDFFGALVLLERDDGAAAKVAVDAFLAANAAHTLAPFAHALRGALLAAEGDAAAAEAAFAKATSPDATAFAAGLKARAGQNPAIPPNRETLGPWGQRSLLRVLVEAGQLDEAEALAASHDFKAADFAETVDVKGEQVQRKFYDPQVFEALAALHARRAIAAAEGQGPVGAWLTASAHEVMGKPVSLDPSTLVSGTMGAELLPALIFGGLASPADLAADASRLAGQAPSGGLRVGFLSALGPVATGPDQGKQVREAQDLGKAWEDQLIAWVGTLPEGDGPAVVRQLQLSRGLVAELVRARADQLLGGGRALEGLALLEYTFEKDQSSKVTFINDPLLFLETTGAYCGLARYREGLNYLYRLLDGHPQLWPVYEVLGNLSVLDTLDQPGVNAQ